MRVGVSGYYGFQNAGDEAILEAIVQEVRARGHQAVVFSNNPAETAQRYGVEAVKRTHPLEVWKALGRIDLLLSGGGGLLQDKTSSLSLWYYLTMLGLARRRGKAVYVFNQSLGPLSQRGERRVRRALRGVPCYFRDEGSLEYGRGLGLEVHLGADPALLLPTPPVEREPNMVVLVPKYGTEAANANLHKLADRLRVEGLEVVVLALQPGFDEPVLEKFSSFTRELAWDPRRVSYLLAQAGYVISVRLHGAILAAAAGTPFAGIAYDPKVAGFCRDAGAVYVDMPGDPDLLASAVLTRRQPNWSAIEAMKARARSSFDQVLSARPQGRMQRSR
ncbi:polysaccharide pyruvyl transferase CsaB [Meiothermus ruber]|jgi:polysaccharide pyruvyl transferase CsaB|uniref:Polysaccharide pyruvyl transferase n=1 Tax=Meiothermus ruber (strain ATCC 35948 / DSM 1279 / VKM B-1258 / 21) TaxID=504728 RepID=D3PLM2_MEIRD|nr:polysaccharide pyruvyl transferase CsaB [Meiothermus ruber]ADD29113.1 polysaccharide pyruvyl transferase [Meiothermus ruber DSM 1279]AGK05436.1 polysaccharide pyruvyl transferase [Meiothermus ruber DSM 1279]MCL6528553.1 polysaccharide pyruvyl transferase CsaB [Meiothermus ruber]MCX7801905.1 polysaccharide pyruvyl transferase CsaB [Meiothermus ruber]GAO76035.1 polysaccharide pyruvyl transferase [Meiothermus ruber H328]